LLEFILSNTLDSTYDWYNNAHGYGSNNIAFANFTHDPYYFVDTDPQLSTDIGAERLMAACHSKNRRWNSIFYYLSILY
jgi:hypothetical protein